MQLFYSDTFSFPLPEGHRFPADKYSQLRQLLLEKAIVKAEQLHVPPAAEDQELLLVHGSDYLKRLAAGALAEKEIRRIGLPWSPELVERSRRSVGGTIAACRAALESGLSANLGGGTHHAHPNFGSGFCIFNDVAVSARVLQREQSARRILILDCDVHQGDGTAVIFRGDSSVFTFSIHCHNNFPFRKAESDLDLPLPRGVGDEEYLSALEIGLSEALHAFRADLVIYIAGGDPFTADRYGQLKLSKAGLSERDRMVYEKCQTHGLPVAIVLGGGYARNPKDVLDIHCQTISLAQDLLTG